MDYQISGLLYYGLPILGLAITSLAQILITSNYSKYKQVASRSHKTGKNVAREILDKHGLKNVPVQEVSGNLTDHYDPTKKVVRLSSDIYSGTSIASVSVAAHECGHAIQDKIGYTPMRIRSKIVPLVNFSTKIGYVVIMIGLIMGALKLALIGLILLLGMLLFQLITLPVEFDASRRGKIELDALHILDVDEQKGSAKMLRAAAFTYVASVLSTFLEILRLALMILPRSDDR
jgi:Zn-dependent membrane protease YugP